MDADEALIDHRIRVVVSVVDPVEHVHIERLVVRDAHRFAQSHLAATTGIQTGVALHQVRNEHFIARAHRLTQKNRIEPPLQNVRIDAGRFVDSALAGHVRVALRGSEAFGCHDAIDTVGGPHELPVLDGAVIALELELRKH